MRNNKFLYFLFLCVVLLKITRNIPENLQSFYLDLENMDITPVICVRLEFDYIMKNSDSFAYKRICVGTSKSKSRSATMRRR